MEILGHLKWTIEPVGDDEGALKDNNNFLSLRMGWWCIQTDATDSHICQMIRSLRVKVCQFLEVQQLCNHLDIAIYVLAG